MTASACYTAVAKENVPCGDEGACPYGQTCEMGTCRGSDYVPPDAAIDAAVPASILSGQRWLSPCEGAATGSNDLCPCAPTPQMDVLALGGDGFSAIKDGTAQQFGAYDSDALFAYFQASSPIAPGVADRIKRTN